MISAFINDCCQNTGSVLAKQLYAVYAQWADDNNEYCMSNTKFGVELAKRYEKVRTTQGIVYSGLSLIADC